MKISPEGPIRSRLASVKFALTSAFLALALTGIPAAQARGPLDGPAPVRVAELPRQGQETLERIRQGGPFQFYKDGMVFGNRERLLPTEKRGYYRDV